MSQSGPSSTIGNGPPSTARFPITPYVVGPVGQAGYQTIQSAINAANAAGGGVVYIQPGTYTEDLTLFDAVDLYGTPAVSQNLGASTTIIGTHTPPATGHIGFNSIYFQDATAIFSSAAAGSTHIVLLNCESAVQNGYFFDLVNWSGILEIWDHNPSASGAPFAVEDGGINNTGGATLYMFAAGFGFGTLNTMNLSGLVVIGEGDISCPVNFGTGSSITIDVVQFDGNVTFSGNSTGSLNTSRFSGGATPAITMSSSATINISSSIVSSTNNPAITGAGLGTLNLYDITYLNNSAIAGTVTKAYPGPTEVGTLFAENVSFNRGSNTIASNGQLIIGKTGDVPQINTLTSGSGITISNGPGTITISATGGTTGSSQTIGAVTADVVTIPLGPVASTYSIEARVAAFEVTTPASAGYKIFGVVRTDGITATLVGATVRDIIEDAALNAADADLIVSGNNAIIRVTGVAGLTIEWDCDSDQTQGV